MMSVAPGATTSDRPTLLVVDPDHAECEFLAAALQDRYTVVTAQRGEGALSVLRSRRVDLVTTEVDLVDVNGFELLQRIRQESRMQDMPVVFLAADDEASSKVMAFELGAHDYLAKPYDLRELGARVDALLRRRTDARLARQQSRYNLAGDFTGMPFTDLVSQLNLGQRTGELALLTRRGGGKLVFINGNIHHAAFGNLAGPEAFFEMMVQEQGRFEFLPLPVAANEIANNIALVPTALMMEGARRMDQARRERAVAGVLDVVLVATDDDDEPRDLTPAMMPDDQFVAALCQCLASEGQVGEMRVLRRQEIAPWTSAMGDSRRAMMLLVTDRSVGLSALARHAAMADTSMEIALCAEPKLLCARFAAGAHGTLDVILIDQDQPEEFLAEFRSEPIAVVVAPLGGDWLDLGVEATLELEALIHRLRPALIGAIGNGSIDEGTARLQEHVGLVAGVELIRGQIGGAHFDLGAVLSRVLRAWPEAVAVTNG